jgi:hypothetical protein
MGPFGNTHDPRRPGASRESGDYVPLLQVTRRTSRNQNIWNSDNEDQDILIAQHIRRRSSDVFHPLLEEDEETRRMSTESGRFLDQSIPSDVELAQTSIENLIQRRPVCHIANRV